MLSRTADQLYWMARYMERAENTARLLAATYEMSLLPHSAEQERNEWQSAVSIAGDAARFAESHGEANAHTVITYLALDQDNTSSIYASLLRARENARALRPLITSEMWEGLNDTYLAMREMDDTKLAITGYRKYFDWVRERSHLFRGAVVGTMLRDDAFQFVRIGTFIERADNTARILDVKYHLLLPFTEQVGGAADYYQWASLLRCVSALKAYRRLFRDAIYPWRVAELLVLRADMPRSLNSCLGWIDQHLNALHQMYGRSFECLRLAGELHARLRYGRIDVIFTQGLHEFLMDFIRQNNALAEEIGRDFMFTA